ncbi:MAG: hypothetical protein JNK45_12380 [Myxococcales bacterium]|nr:hypothetical protein [Myxococcales bacterium]
MPVLVRRGLGILAVGCLGCDALDAAPVEPGAAAPTAAGPATVDEARATVPASASAPAPESLAGIAAASDAPEFDVVATQFAGDMRLFETHDGQAFAVSGPWVTRLHRDGTLEVDPTWTRGIATSGSEYDNFSVESYGWHATSMGGTWPEGAYLVVMPGWAGRGSDLAQQVYRRVQARWTPVATRQAAFDWAPQSFGPWRDGSVLALRSFAPRYRAFDDSGGPTDAEQRRVGKIIAAQKRLVVLRGRPRAPAFGGEDVRAFASLSTGSIVAAVAKDPDTEHSRVVMIHHGIDGTIRRVPLPDAGPDPFDTMVVQVRADDDAWLFGRATEGTAAWVARFDGERWRRLTVPCVSGIAAAAVDPRGDAYLVCDVAEDPAAGDRDSTRTAALLRVRGEVVAWLPTPVPAAGIVAHGPDDLWVVGASIQGEATLLHTGTTLTAPEQLPDPETIARRVFEWADPVPLGRGCLRGWIPLVAGVDPAAVQARLDALPAADAGTAQLVQARVQGRGELGVAVFLHGDAASGRALTRVLAALGADVGAPTCNHRPEDPTPPR